MSRTRSPLAEAATCLAMAAAIAAGSDEHSPRQTILPLSEMTQTDVVSRDTSNPTYCCSTLMVNDPSTRLAAELLPLDPRRKRLHHVPTPPEQHRAQGESPRRGR